MIKDVIDKLKIAVFPKRCEMCGEIICFDEHLCEDCEALPYIEAPVCLKCGCSKDDCICKKHKREVEYKAVVAPFYYEGSVSRGILNMKMNEMPRLADAQGSAVAKIVKKYYELIDFDFVTFVPMLKSDISDRGFNQAELLAKAVSKECAIPIKDVLYKKRKTKMQKRQNAKERFANMYNAFDVKENENVSGAKILLIDDVKTTGATLTSASLILKAYGAECVYCAAVAIVK